MVKEKKVRRKRIKFSVSANSESKVYVAGDFNNWDPSNKELKDANGDGSFEGSILLEPGKYEYKFVVDKTWTIDPQCDEWKTNGYGSINSLINI
ncbi:MAG: isoamylase early set domain-containing protein [Kiritimatiellae bacterium]|jgi:1,4-alpha-glucan branching enzyme|nr:isoamylase early set domain-containing protein [Kiritimatiellia bacterium]